MKVFLKNGPDFWNLAIITGPLSSFIVQAPVPLHIGLLSQNSSKQFEAARIELMTPLPLATALKMAPQSYLKYSPDLTWSLKLFVSMFFS